jgi:aminopeptidase O
MFISQSVVMNSDLSMLVRLSHEISHNWFGLVIGAMDWTEEWLSEVRP